MQARLTTRSALLATLFVVAAICVAISPRAHAAPLAAKPPWGTSKVFPLATEGAVDSACPTTSGCFVLMLPTGQVRGAALASTQNGGTSWQVLPLPTNFSITSADSNALVLDALACPSATTCLILGEDSTTQHPELARTSDRGLHWKVIALPAAFAESDSSFLAPSIACLTVTVCLAATGSDPNSGAILSTTNAGSTWQAKKTTTFPLVWISCASSKACGALGGGSLLSTINGGTSWQSHSLPANSSQADQIACSAAASCLAAGSATNEIWRTSNRGATWHSTTLPKSFGVQSMSCGTAAICEAVRANTPTSAIWRTTDSGATWKVQSTPAVTDGFSKANAASDTLDTIVCRGAKDCLIGGHTQAEQISFYVFGFLLGTVNGGQTWAQRPLPQGLGELAGISCVSTAQCEAVGSHPAGVFVGTSDSGSKWKVQLKTVPEVDGAYTDIACTSSKQCVAVGGIDTGPVSGIGAVAHSTDGGATWATKSIPAAFVLSGVSCPSATVCVAVGFASNEESAVLLKTVNAARTWTQQALPSGVGRLTDVACGSTTHCTAVGDSSGGGPVIVATGDGKKWKIEPLPAALSAQSFLLAITCPTSTVCEAAGGVFGGAGVLIVTRNAGAKWAIQKVPASAGQLNGIACASAQKCDAVGLTPSQTAAVAVHTSDGGSHWTSQRLPAGVGSLTSVSCPSATTCYAAGASTHGAGMLLKTT